MRFSLYDIHETKSADGDNISLVSRCRGYRTYDGAVNALNQHWGRWFSENKVWKIVDHEDNSVSFIENPHFKEKL